MLKRIDQGVLAGQCNIASLPERDPDKLVSLEEFQEDVRQALGKSFGAFVEAKQIGRWAGHRVLRVVAQGVVHGKDDRGADPLDLLSRGRPPRPPGGADLHRSSRNELEQFADADRKIVQSLRFAEPGKRDGIVGGEGKRNRSMHSPSMIRSHPVASHPYPYLPSKKSEPPRSSVRGTRRLVMFGLPADCDWMRRFETERRSGVLLH